MPRPCSVCSHSSRAAIDSRLASAESFQRVASAFNVSVASLKRHKHAGHVAEAVQAHAEARSIADKVREADQQVADLSFQGDLAQQAATLRDHGIALLRRARARGDDRTAIAATATIQRALEMLVELDKQQAGSVGENACPSVLVYPANWTEGPPAWLTRQLPGVTVWLPDNGRGDSMAFNGEAGEDSDQSEVLP